MSQKKIVVVEDDADIARLIAHCLEKSGFTVKAARDGTEGLSLVQREDPDLVILDLMLPELDGLEVCKRLRGESRTARLPIMMVTARGEESDRVIGLELGADDYIVKPFSPKELTARVRALLRRSGPPPKEEADILQYGTLQVDVARHEVRVKEQEVQLTAKEFGLLAQLLKNRGRVLTREFLLDTVWGYSAEVSTRTVDVHIRRLREKIPALQDAIETITSYGYKLKEV